MKMILLFVYELWFTWHQIAYFKISRYPYLQHTTIFNIDKLSYPHSTKTAMISPSIDHCPGRDIVVNSTGKRTLVHLPRITVSPRDSRIRCTGGFNANSSIASEPASTHRFSVGKHRIRCTVKLRSGEMFDSFLQVCSFTVRVRGKWSILVDYYIQWTIIYFAMLWKLVLQIMFGILTSRSKKN